MESVETVLEQYGGAEEDWYDTFGVARDADELAENAFERVEYDEERSKLLTSDKAVRFVLQVSFLSSFSSTLHKSLKWPWGHIQPQAVLGGS